MTPEKQFKTWLPAFALGFVSVAALGYWLASRDPQPSEATAKESATETKVTEEAREAPLASLHRRIEAAEVSTFPALIQEILKNGNPAERDQAITALMSRWLAEDLDSFIAFLDESEVNGLPIWDGIAAGMMAALGRMEETIMEKERLATVVERVLLKTAESNPEDALAWARGSLSGTHLDFALAGIAVDLADHSPEAAIALLDEVQAFPNQMQAAAGIGLALGRSGHALAMTWAESFFSETERSFALSGVLSGMASRDTARAAEEYSRIVEAMKIQHRDQVLADRANAGSTLDEEYEGLSPEEIEKSELAKPNPNLVYLETASRAIALELARKNPQEALNWAHSMDLYQGKAVALETIYDEWSSVDPRVAFQSLLLETDRRPEVAGKLFGNWAMKNARLASASALTLEPGIERDFAIEGVAKGWIHTGEPAEVAAWADQLHTVSEKDRVRAVVAAEVAYENPELAWKQVEGIRNPLKRSELSQEVFPNLVEENPKLARSVLATIQLSPVEIEYFQDMLGP